MNNTEAFIHSLAYDIAFADRDYKTECNFLEWCYKNLSAAASENKSLIELASGPASHAIEMAHRGWNCTISDRSENMLHYAKTKASQKNLNLDSLHCNISEFNSSIKYDMAVTLLEGISHITTNEGMVKHFKQVAESLKPGGIYVIEATHPMYFFPDPEPNVWISEQNGTRVEVAFGLPSDKYNSVTQQWNITTKMKVTNDGKEYFFESANLVRWYLSQEIKALIELSGAFVEYYFFGSLMFVPPKELDQSDESDAMVIVLKTKS